MKYTHFLHLQQPVQWTLRQWSKILETTYKTVVRHMASTQYLLEGTRPQPDFAFGGCPECGESHNYLNVGRSHWFYCEAHKLRWWAGSNLMSTWRNETEGDWQRNAEKLSEFQEGDPVAYWVDIRGRINPTGTEAVNDAFHDRQARQ